MVTYLQLYYMQPAKPCLPDDYVNTKEILRLNPKSYYISLQFSTEIYCLPNVSKIHVSTVPSNYIKKIDVSPRFQEIQFIF